MPINLFGTFDECLHKAVGNNEKYRPYQLFQEYMRERVMQTKFYLAGVFRQGNETPVTIQILKRAVQQCYFNQFRWPPGILGGKAVLDVMIVDLDSGMGNGRILRTNR